MRLTIRNRVINDSMINILNHVKEDQRNKYLRIVNNKYDNVAINCPFHKNGQEKHSSCQVLATDENEQEYGVFHCFACGKRGNLIQLVSYCLDIDYREAENFLIENHSTIFISEEQLLPEITFDTNKKHILDENCLYQYNTKHPYMYSRKLTDEVIERFKIGYDNKNDCIVFPVWDEKNNLVTITKRSTKGKKFILEKDVEKPVYLLNEIIKNNIDTVIVCESQINALTCWSYGFPAIALFGTGTQHQYDILNKSGIRNYILAFDGDFAGKVGANKFKHNMKDDVMIYTLNIPDNKDINDLDKEEFLKLLDFLTNTY